MRTKILAAPLAVALSRPLASLALSDPPNDARDDARRRQSYLIRVARRSDSVAGHFKLRLEGAGGPRLPGPPLPRGGVSGSLDRDQQTAQAWSVRFRRGTRYRIRLVGPRNGCVRASVYSTGVRPRAGLEPPARTNCHGNGLFTPRPGDGTRFSIFVNAAGGVRGRQRYHLQAAPAGRDDSAPGRFVPNYARMDGVLDAGSVDALDLFRFDVTRRSVLFLHLRSPDAEAAHDLLLLDAFGTVLRCTCGGLGSAELRKGLQPGRYFSSLPAHAGGATRRTRCCAPHERSPTRSCASTARGRPSSRPASRRASRSAPSPRSTAPSRCRSSSSTRSPAGSSPAAWRRRRATAGRPSRTRRPTEGRWCATAEYDGTAAAHRARRTTSSRSSWPARSAKGERWTRARGLRAEGVRGKVSVRPASTSARRAICVCDNVRLYVGDRRTSDPGPA
jgi:hypothetical protein